MISQGLPQLFLLLVGLQFSSALDFKAPDLRPPTGLTAHGGANSVYLTWNESLEPDLAGYLIMRGDTLSGFKPLISTPIPKTEYTDPLPTGAGASYRVIAVLASGQKSDPSTAVDAVVESTVAPTVTAGPLMLSVPGQGAEELPHALKVVFSNGQTLVFDTDRLRVRDWVTEGGTHLLQSRAYGDAIALTQENNWGFSVPEAATPTKPAQAPSLTLESRTPGKATFIGHTLVGDRITFQYSLPLAADSSVTVWETFWPVTRKLRVSGSVYKGLARQIEIATPANLKNGYSVVTNDGFGVDGSCDKAVTYELGWTAPGLTTRNWVKGQDMKGNGQARITREFHPDMQTLQTIPFVFMSFPQGTLILAAEHYVHATGFSLTNYAAQGQDGLWPNFYTDCATSGRRFRVETFEWLFTSDTQVLPPQQFIDASFHYRRRVAHRYGLTEHHTAMAYAWDYWGPNVDRNASLDSRLTALRNWGKDMASRAVNVGADRVGGAHMLWTSGPEATPDDIRLNDSHPINLAIKDMVKSFNDKGIEFGYWIRPEFTRVSHEDLMSPTIDATHPKGDEKNHYQYDTQVYPDFRALMAQSGLPLVRNHQAKWVRVGRDGSGTSGIKTSYDWVPMSFTQPDGWYENLVYPAIVMQRALGYGSLFQDGGPSAMPGIDYTGGIARAVQPYYWRYLADVYHQGMNVQGEVAAGFGGSSYYGEKIADAAVGRASMWAFSHGTIRGNRDGVNNWFSAADRHRALQLYVSANIDLNSSTDNAKVMGFHKKILGMFGHPDNIVLKGLRQQGGVWVWDEVWWEKNNGQRMRYPDYNQIDQPIVPPNGIAQAPKPIDLKWGVSGGLLILPWAGELSVKLVNPQGHLVLERKSSGPTRLNLSEFQLPNGKYVLQVQSPAARFQRSVLLLQP